MISLKLGVQWLSAGAALVSACLWLYSAKTSVKPSDRRDKDTGMSPLVVRDTNTGDDVFETMGRQSRWNSYAAVVASLAATLQAVSMLLPDDCCHP
jgi:hypothetical protein